MVGILRPCAVPLVFGTDGLFADQREQVPTRRCRASDCPPMGPGAASGRPISPHQSDLEGLGDLIFPWRIRRDQTAGRHANKSTGSQMVRGLDPTPVTNQFECFLEPCPDHDNGSPICATALLRCSSVDSVSRCDELPTASQAITSSRSVGHSVRRITARTAASSRRTEATLRIGCAWPSTHRP
jgi:hypothetical protein